MTKSLLNFYNKLDVYDTGRFTLYKTMVLVATKEKKIDTIRPIFKNIESCIAEWGLQETEKGSFLVMMSDALKESE
jgi:hypothetical protein